MERSPGALRGFQTPRAGRGSSRSLSAGDPSPLPRGVPAPGPLCRSGGCSAVRPRRLRLRDEVCSAEPGSRELTGCGQQGQSV